MLFFISIVCQFGTPHTEPGIERGRTLTRITSMNKYGGAAANFRGRKSNSLMNLCGKRM